MKLTLVVLFGISLIACSGDHGDPELAKRGADWLRTYYKQYPPAEGKWAVTTITTEGGAIQAKVLIPDDGFVAKLMSMPSENQFKYLSTVVCPNRFEEFWRIANPEQNYRVEVGGLSAGVFISIDCRLWVK